MTDYDYWGQDSLVPLLESSRLEYVHVVIADTFSDDQEVNRLIIKRRLWGSLPIVRSGIDIQDIDITELAVGIAACGTSLRVVVLTLGTRAPSVWVVDRTEGQVSVERLDTDAGRRIIEREEEI